MSVRAGMSERRGNSHFNDVPSNCLKSFFLVPFFFLATRLLGLQKLSVLVTHSSFFFIVLISLKLDESQWMALKSYMVSKCTIQLNQVKFEWFVGWFVSKFSEIVLIKRD